MSPRTHTSPIRSPAYVATVAPEREGQNIHNREGKHGESHPRRIMEDRGEEMVEGRQGGREAGDNKEETVQKRYGNGPEGLKVTVFLSGPSYPSLKPGLTGCREKACARLHVFSRAGRQQRRTKGGFVLMSAACRGAPVTGNGHLHSRLGVSDVSHLGKRRVVCH